MTPYYEQDGITIIHDDCRNVALPMADLVITDPPYGMAYQSNRRFIKHDRINNDEDLPLDIINLAISKATRAAYVFCRWDNLAEMPKPKSVVAWVKNLWTAGDLEHEHGRQWEACCFYPKSGHEFIKRIPDVIYADKTGNVFHPTQKPEAVTSTIIAANVGDLVMDLCMGSGSTLLSAKQCGRRAIGIETDERYCEIAAKRLAQGVLFGLEAAS